MTLGRMIYSIQLQREKQAALFRKDAASAAGNGRNRLIDAETASLPCLPWTASPLRTGFRPPGERARGSDMTTLPSEVDVAIIGAGAAGFGAAHALKQSGLSCVVLEARDRIGGRAHTIAASPEITFDLGCG